MGRTLFWYVFKDLVKIFFMASGALAGIMSFAALLRPLTQNGLDGSQVALLLRYLMPAMSTYSLPVAALFATTVVYGRMSADNELTACRASGVSFLSMSTPAMLLGLTVSFGSLFLLGFTVPAATQKIEQVIVSNLGKLIVHQIEQTHETHFGTDINSNFTIFAQDASLAPSDPAKPNDSAVILRGPMIVRYQTPPGKAGWFHTARLFQMAKQAIAYIHQDPRDASATMRIHLTDGSVFPRRFTGPKSQEGGIDAAEFIPDPIPSPLLQKPKYMDFFQLKALDQDPYQGREVQQVVADFVKEDQSAQYLQQLSDSLNTPVGKILLQSGGDTYTVTRSTLASTAKGNTLMLTTVPGSPPLRFSQSSGGQIHLNAEARSVRITSDADTAHDLLYISMDLNDTLVDAGDVPSPQAHLARHFAVDMPPDIAAMKTRTAELYIHGNLRSNADRNRLSFALEDLVNHIRSEMHARAAFVISCLLLVLIGASLGMMFRSGNFLTAFAVSVIPAMFSIVLIVTGQHTAESTPFLIGLNNNPLMTGLSVIWFGNIVIAATAIALLWRLQRQ
jgi:lipopolysaccharide export LptBFGC system permease protein LptF